MLDESVNNILKSKKFQAAIVAVLVGAGAKLGLDFDPATLGVLISPLLVYIGSQALADKGKEAAVIQKQAVQIQADSAAKVANIEAGATVKSAQVTAEAGK